MLSLKAQVGNVYGLLQIKKLEREAGEGQLRAEDGMGRAESEDMKGRGRILAMKGHQTGRLVRRQQQEDEQNNEICHNET